MSARALASATISFGLVSIRHADLLVEGTPLARAIAGFVAAWWGARVLVQFIGFSKHAPNGLRFRVAEGALTALFVAFAVVYSVAAFTAEVGP